MPPDLGSGPNLITPYEISLDGPRIPDIDVHNQPDGGAKGALARTLLCRSSPSPRSAANSLISSIAGSSLGSCATSLPRTARLKIVCLSCLKIGRASCRERVCQYV